MIINNVPYCDGCHQELKAWTPDEALEALPPCGWHDWRTAHKHYCNQCSDAIMDKIGFPPCGQCETQPCEKGRECWANPPLHIFPYETFFGETLTDNAYDNKFDLEEPIEDEVRRRQKMKIEANNTDQRLIVDYLVG